MYKTIIAYKKNSMFNMQISDLHDSKMENNYYRNFQIFMNISNSTSRKSCIEAS